MQRHNSSGALPGARGVADPHPSNQERYDRHNNLGGAHPLRNDLGPNDAINDGKPKKRPRRRGAPG